MRFTCPRMTYKYNNDKNKSASALRLSEMFACKCQKTEMHVGAHFLRTLHSAMF